MRSLAQRAQGQRGEAGSAGASHALRRSLQGVQAVGLLSGSRALRFMTAAGGECGAKASSRDGGHGELRKLARARRRADQSPHTRERLELCRPNRPHRQRLGAKVRGYLVKARDRGVRAARRRQRAAAQQAVLTDSLPGCIWVHARISGVSERVSGRKDREDGSEHARRAAQVPLASRLRQRPWRRTAWTLTTGLPELRWCTWVHPRRPRIASTIPVVQSLPPGVAGPIRDRKSYKPSNTPLRGSLVILLVALDRLLLLLRNAHIRQVFIVIVGRVLPPPTGSRGGALVASGCGGGAALILLVVVLDVGFPARVDPLRVDVDWLSEI